MDSEGNHSFQTSEQVSRLKNNQVANVGIDQEKRMTNAGRNDLYTKVDDDLDQQEATAQYAINSESQPTVIP